MKQFKEGQIVKATTSTYYLEVGEIAFENDDGSI